MLSPIDLLLLRGGSGACTALPSLLRCSTLFFMSIYFIYWCQREHFHLAEAESRQDFWRMQYGEAFFGMWEVPGNLEYCSRLLWCWFPWQWFPGNAGQGSWRDLILSSVTEALGREMHLSDSLSDYFAMGTEVGSRSVFKVFVKFSQDCNTRSWLFGNIKWVTSACIWVCLGFLSGGDSWSGIRILNHSPFWRVTGYRCYITGILILVRHLTSGKTHMALKTSLFQGLIFY